MIQELHKYVDTDFALCTQWDGYVINPSAWTDEFLQWDYVAPVWWFNDNKNIGCGGFSLRSKKFLKVCSSLQIKNFHPEDLILCRVYRTLLEQEGIKFAPEVLGRIFGHEGNAKVGVKWNGQFGWHDSEVTNLCNCKNKLTEQTIEDQYKYWGNKF